MKCEGVPAVLASLVLVVTKSSVECGEFAKLVALELVLAFWDGGSLYVISICGEREAT